MTVWGHGAAHPVGRTDPEFAQFSAAAAGLRWSASRDNRPAVDGGRNIQGRLGRARYCILGAWRLNMIRDEPLRNRNGGRNQRIPSRRRSQATGPRAIPAEPMDH